MRKDPEMRQIFKVSAITQTLVSRKNKKTEKDIAYLKVYNVKYHSQAQK